jgi:hypothetical protein
MENYILKILNKCLSFYKIRIIRKAPANLIYGAFYTLKMYFYVRYSTVLSSAIPRLPFIRIVLFSNFVSFKKSEKALNES